MLENIKEKKVEYLELIYDLIFVYIIGRNNSLLQHIEGGFVPSGVFLAYVLGTLAVIQIWNFSTFYINIYGRNKARDHIFLFINMYLLYFMADSTNIQWRESFYKYSFAWMLILINIGLQHIIELKNHKNAPWEIRQLKYKSAIILIEAMLVGVHILVFYLTQVTIPYVPIVFGIIAMMISGRKNKLVFVDFAHLTERVMLYVVFTFGEMIIAIASYFKGDLSFSTIYFSLFAFLIVVGLFLSYGTLYNRLLDRQKQTDGTGYMLIHIFLIFALNNISASLEFMREEEVDLLSKTLFLVGSFLIYHIFLFLTGRYTKKYCGFKLSLVLKIAASTAVFVTLMIALRQYMYINIFVSVLYVFGIFLTLFVYAKKHIAEEE